MKRFELLLTAWLTSTVVAAESPESDADIFFPQQLSARELMVYCASSSMTDRGRLRQRYCAGFVSGVEESLRLLRVRLAPEHGASLCVPAKTTARQFQDAFIRHAGRPGSDLNRPAVLVVVEALRAAYPCQGD